jgi:UDP-2,4-diacetamido-2,4,6-trideoxy-beta-L-altropyranose hydrolase
VLTSPPLLLVRADGGPEIGIGHAMRCLGVAQAWRGKNAPCAWARVEAPSGLETRLREEGIESVSLAAARGSLEDARELAELARARGAAWTLVDGYRFDLAYQEVLAGAGLRVAWMDDRGAPGGFVADLVVNPNVAIRSEWYDRCEARTRVLRGPRYAPLRREFSARPRGEREFPDRARRILISLGGADPDNASLAVMRAAAGAGVAGTEVRVIAGPANPHLSLLQAAATAGVEVVSSVDDMAEALEWADVAVTGAGGTVWEALYLGVPTLLVVIAEDQRGNALELERRGVARLLGDGTALDQARVAGEIARLLDDPARRQEMSLSGRALVDGRGASRIVAAMREAEIGLRRAGAGDSELLFRWANDPVTRAASFSGAPIAWDDHQRWLQSKLADPACVMFVGSTPAGDALGTVRFERESAVAVVSTTVDASWRDRGYGAALIRAACRAYFASPSADAVEAYVKEDNEASRRAFLAAGFEEDGSGQRGGVAARRLVLGRTEASR